MIMENKINPGQVQDTESTILLSTTLLRNTAKALGDFFAVVRVYLTTSNSSDDEEGYASTATVGNFEALTIDELRVLRDGFVSCMSDLQYFAEVYTRVVDIALRKKLSA